MKYLAGAALAIMLATWTVLASEAPALTQHEADLQRLALAQSQIAQLLASMAACEANGTQSAKAGQQARDTYKQLTESLAARGLILKTPDGQPEAIPAERGK